MGERLDHLILKALGAWNRIVAPPAPGDRPRAFMLTAGATVGGRYRLIKMLGEGGMGRVWLVDDRVEKRSVALKELRSPPGLNERELEASALLFRREFHAMKKLQHPGTVRVFDSGVLETQDRFLTMEVVEGQSLDALVQQRPMKGAAVLDVLSQLAQVLSFVHARLFVHCDIKAENIRLTPRGAIKLMDFGLMHQLGTTPAGQLKGTPGYMAPEWPKGAVIDARTDLYSLGCLGFLLLTGRLPFAGRTLTEILEGHLHRAPPSPAALVPGVDEKAASLVLQLLEKDPAQRPSSASELLVRISELTGKPVPAEPLAARASYLHVAELVGRDAETARLEAALEGARTGEGARGLLIGAPAGVGKSRLLQEFELKVKLHEVPWSVGFCRPEGLAPLAPLAQALSGLLPLAPDDLLTRHRPLLGKLVPSIAVEKPPAFKDPAAEKAALFHALGAFLTGLQQHTPFVLVVEDLHWADQATLEFLNVVVRALHRSRGLVLATYRSNELDRLSPAFATVDEGLSDVLELSNLTPQHLATLVSLALRGYEAPPEFAAALFNTTAGNAFFATECLRQLVEAGVLSRAGGRWVVEGDLSKLNWPKTLTEVVSARLSSLSAERLEQFRRLAPMGRVLELPAVRALTELRDDGVFELLDEGVERQFLQYTEGRYFFSHESVRSTLYQETPEPMRRTHHGRIAQLLERTSSTDESARSIGYHYARSDQPRRAIAPLMKASEQALAKKAIFDTSQLLKESVGLLEGAPDYPQQRALLTSMLGRLVEVGYNGHPPSCLEASTKLFAHWQSSLRLDDGRTALWSLSERAEKAAEGTRKKLLQTMGREIPVQEPMSAEDAFVKRAEFRILVLILLGASSRAADFEKLFSEVMTEQPPGSPFRSAVMCGRAILYGHTGRYEELPGLIKAAAELRRFRGDVQNQLSRRLTWALGLLDYTVNQQLAMQGLPIDENLTREGLAIAEEGGFSDLKLHHSASRVTHAIYTGDGARFPELFSKVEELVRQQGRPLLLESRANLFVPLYFLERAERELAEAATQRLSALSKRLPMDRSLKLYAQISAACCRVLRGDGEAALAEMQAAVSAAKESEFVWLPLAQVYLARLLEQTGRRSDAVQQAQEAFSYVTGVRHESYIGQVLALRALADSQPEQASEHLSKAIQLCVKTQNRLQEGIVSLAWAQSQLKGDRAGAAQSMERARACFEQVRAPVWLQRVQQFVERAAQR